MKIGILTQPLHNNYGGLLQAFALQKVLNDLGHEVWIIRRENRPNWRDFTKYYTKRVIASAIGKQIYPLLTQKQKTIISQYNREFISQYMGKQTNKLFTSKQFFKAASKFDFEAYVVGSDQVWRPRYSPQIGIYFLDFLSDDSTKRIAYAASFGVDNWEFNEKDTLKFATLAKKFDAISVREESGIDLCEKYFGVHAVQSLDPTMLLERVDYENLIVNQEQSNGDLFYYILDPSKEKMDIVSKIAYEKKLEPFTEMPKEITINNLKNINNCIYPGPLKWLKAFQDAKFVVTDSFHGCVFSIIFNKPFILFGNEKRGLTRFKSLLKQFGLENRIYSDNNSFKIIIESSIDWSVINKTWENLRSKSIDFFNFLH